MPNEEIVAKIEELKRICDPNENEAKLVLELKQINDLEDDVKPGEKLLILKDVKV